MDAFTRAVEIVFKESEGRDGPSYCPESALWDHAVQHCGYVQLSQAVGRVLATV